MAVMPESMCVLIVTNSNLMDGEGDHINEPVVAQIAMPESMCVLIVANSDLMDSEGNHVDKPVISQVAEYGVAAVPKGGAHCQGRKS